MRICLTIEYDGTAYCGWQRQKNGVSVQEKIEDALFALTGENRRQTGDKQAHSGDKSGGCDVMQTQKNVAEAHGNDAQATKEVKKSTVGAGRTEFAAKAAPKNLYCATDVLIAENVNSVTEKYVCINNAGITENGTITKAKATGLYDSALRDSESGLWQEARFDASQSAAEKNFSSANGELLKNEMISGAEPAAGGYCGIVGAGRTDAGVHALGQAAHFDTQAAIPPEKYSYALNSLLPKDIRIIDSKEASGEFHARFSAKKKHYRYVIHNAPHASAVGGRFSAHIPIQLSIEKMREAAAHFLGEHDFIGFSSAGRQTRTTVRTVYSLEISKSGADIAIDITGNGFLYNMVRIIAGTLIYVGEGKIVPEDIPAIIKSGDRRRSGITAPPQGLFLVSVSY